MLSKPTAGWTTITLGEKKISASYLTDVPFDLAKGIIETKMDKTPHAVTIDAESAGTYIILFDVYQTYIIEEDFEPKIFLFEKNIEELSKELASDLEKYFKDWLLWEDDYDPLELDEETQKKYNNIIFERE